MSPLEHDKYYHIYNRGINGEDLFVCDEDYNKFMLLLEKYIYPIADIYTWVLMKNHFHMLVRIKDEQEIGFYLPLNSDRSNDSVRFKTTGRYNLSESVGPDRVISTNKSISVGPDRVISTNKSISVGPDRVISINTTNNPFNSDSSDDSVRLNKHPDPSRHFSHLFNSYSKYYNLKYQRTGSLFERPFKRIKVETEDYLRNLVVYINTNPVHHGFNDDFTNYPWSGYLSIISSASSKLKRDEVINWFGDIENLKYMHHMKINTELPIEILLE